MNFTDQEIAHILACLRACQGVDIKAMSQFDDTKPLSDEEINSLSEKINCEGNASGQYTVVGLLSDTYWGDGMHEASFVRHIEATSGLEAAKKARLEVGANHCFINKEEDPEAYVEELEEAASATLILAAFEGVLMDKYDQNTEV